ncbi:3-oxo-tetronate kinase [Brachybacterium hainanense]|uniref:3-oxo-tetronate kinase n=1 Tax=Brachybacterium hainanense TaxID=1541174 RepID=A0ABV6RBG6_9MICO
MLGAIADDFTGATDLATMLRRSGHRVAVLVNEDPAPRLRAEGTEDPMPEVDAVVTALKTRTVPAAEAVRRSLAALARLQRLGAERIYVKYCSTFDSTPQGNIGPVLDAIAAALGARGSVVVPSLPANGRTVRDGLLRVGEQLLEDSPMRHHPLTPMTASRVRDLLRPQTIHEVGEIGLRTVAAGADALRSALDAAPEPYQVLDAVTDEHLRIIAAATAGHRLVSGGSGLALGIPGPGLVADAWRPPAAGRRAVLCGSVSARSLEQIAHAARSQPVHVLDVTAAARDPRAAAQEAAAWVLAQDPAAIPVLCAARERSQVQAPRGGVDPAAVVETVLSQAARLLVENGQVRALLVAGGESSGAVVGALGVHSLHIGPEIAPGVCWSRAHARGADLALALKSGNFGEPDMFTSAWEALA